MSIRRKLNKLLLKNKQALRIYWPLLLLAQLPALIICLILPFKQTVTAFDKKNNADTSKQLVSHIKNIEHRFNELNQRFLALQIQHAKFVKASILLTATVQQGSSPSVNLFKKTTLDILDRIGEKIRLNEPFSGLLASLPKECSSFSGYKTLKQFSVRLPLNHQQLKKAFDDIQKNYPFLVDKVSQYNFKLNREEDNTINFKKSNALLLYENNNVNLLIKLLDFEEGGNLFAYQIEGYNAEWIYQKDELIKLNNLQITSFYVF